MKKKAKKITMDVLAGMVQKGFAETARRIDLVGVKKDVATLKSDVFSLKEDVATLKEDVKSLKEDFHKILDGLDKVAKQYSNYLEERKMRDAEINRLKRWVEQIAQKVGVELVD